MKSGHIRHLVGAILALAFFCQPVLAQYMPAGAAGSSGGACTTGYFGWPDSSGYPLQCVSSAWALAGDFSSSDYTGTSCSGSQYVQSLSSAGVATCATPAGYTNYSGSTANTVTALSSTIYVAVQSAMGRNRLT